MDRMIYLSMSGAKAALSRQDSLANNLANVSTPGFRAETHRVPGRARARRRRVHARVLAGDHAGLQRRAGPDQRDRAQPGRRDDRQVVDGRAGTRRHRGLHPAPARCRSTPRACWSRRAACRSTATAARSRCRANAQVDIADDGTITAKVEGQKPQQIGKLKLVTPEGPMDRGPDGLFRADSGDLSADPARAPAVGRARRLQREPGGDDGRHDRRRAAVRASDEDAGERREAGSAGVEAAQRELIGGGRDGRRGVWPLLRPRHHLAGSHDADRARRPGLTPNVG